MADFRRYLDLWWQLTCRELAARHRGSGLGSAWLVLGPLLEFAVYFSVFGFIFGGRYRDGGGETATLYALGVLLSLACHRLLADTLNQAAGCVLAQPNFVKKVVFPLELLPLTLLGVIVQRFLLTLALFTAAYVVWGPSTGSTVLWVPVVVVPLLLLAAGIAWGLSAVGVFLRDLGQFMPTLSMVMLFSSCVFYSPEKVRAQGETLWAVLRFNPLLQAVDALRRCVLWGETPSLAGLAWLWACGVGAALAGYGIFRKLRGGFADVL